MGDLGAKEYLPDIAAQLKDTYPDARHVAAVALGALTGQGFTCDDAGVLAAQAWWDQHKNDPEFAPKR